MIDRLTGSLVAVDLTEIVVDAGGVGYAVTVPLSTYDRLPRVGNQVQIFTHLHVREDLMQLYGFADPKERQLFRMLLTVSGIGPRLALNVLSCMSIESFCRAVTEGNVKALTTVNGLGKRSGERLVMELRDRVADIEPAAAFSGGGESKGLHAQAQDAIAALETLGFKTETARKTVQKLCSELAESEQSAEALIRKALQSVN